MTRNLNSIFSFLFFLLISSYVFPLFAASGRPTEQPLEKQTTCPIMRKPIDPIFFTDWEGDEEYRPKRIYLCCPPCEQRFHDSPRRHLRTLRRMGQKAEVLSLDTNHNSDHHHSEE
ncbi:hypothetical protein CHISP_3679 [Chitinispirillum alkaliphilum]|nr:hypothetical protein CHISP_3679 [Chitinispirillum alkaliphilum]